MFAQLVECTGLSLLDLQPFLQHYETGFFSTEQLYHKLQSMSPHSFSLLELMQAGSNIFTPNTALWPTVEELKKQGTKLVLISNTNECHFNYVSSHYPILRLFDSLILSYKIGICKPDPRIFQRALAESKGQNFYTDDIPTFIEAGREAGLDAEVYTDPLTLRRHLRERGFLGTTC